LVSIIIPNYNHAHYLQQRIESILNQTFQDWELIILDDCSTDQSREVIEQYRNHPRISRIEYNEANSGSTFRQWGKGLEYAQGEWIWIAESDDYCDVNFLECLLDPAIPEHAGLRYALSRPVDANSQLIDDTLYHPGEGYHKGFEFLEKHLLQLNRIPNASAVIVKKTLLKNTLTKKLQEFKLLSDWIIWNTIAMNSDLFYTERTNNYHRYHPSNVRSRLFKQLEYYKEFPVFREIMEQAINASSLPNVQELIRINKKCAYNEKGYRAIELWRKHKYRQSIPLLLEASTRPSPNTYFIRSIFYWMKRDRNQRHETE
jgi:glycosyltransferase involved in cell wall biosynthesis